jgi:hypothetical protein
MTESTQGTSVLRQRMIEDMRMRKLTPKTQAAAYTASVIMDCSPTPTASTISPPFAIFCISRRPRLPMTLAIVAPITAAPGPPSCADTAAPPMLVIETFGRAQHIRGPPGSSAAP